MSPTKSESNSILTPLTQIHFARYTRDPRLEKQRRGVAKRKSKPPAAKSFIRALEARQRDVDLQKRNFLINEAGTGTRAVGIPRFGNNVMGGENALFSPQTVYRRSSTSAPDSCKLCELTDSHGNEIKSVSEYPANFAGSEDVYIRE